tara:strand:- start:53 stop:286 length:234 start_codon:yes stop_codon:yes gene_type:complete
MIAKIIMFLGEALLNLRFINDEIALFFTSSPLFPYVTFKVFLNTIRYEEYKILYWIIIIALITYILWLILFEDKKNN